MDIGLDNLGTGVTTDRFHCSGTTPLLNEKLKMYAGLLRTKMYSAFHPSGIGKWVPAAAGRAKAGIAHSACGWNAGCAGKTVLFWQCVLYLSALETFRIEALYKSTTFTYHAFHLSKKNSSKFVESFLSYPVIVYGKTITSLAKVVITYVDKKEDDHSAAVPWWRVASVAVVAAADR